MNTGNFGQTLKDLLFQFFWLSILPQNYKQIIVYNSFKRHLRKNQNGDINFTSGLISSENYITLPKNRITFAPTEKRSFVIGSIMMLQ